MITIHRPQAGQAVRLRFTARATFSILATTNLETFITLPSKIEKTSKLFFATFGAAFSFRPQAAIPNREEFFPRL